MQKKKSKNEDKPDWDISVLEHADSDLQANTKHLHSIYTTSAQHLQRWSSIVQMLCKCFVFTVLAQKSVDIEPMSG